MSSVFIHRAYHLPVSIGILFRTTSEDPMTLCDCADISQMIGEGLVDPGRIEVSELRDISESQLKRDSGIILRFPDKDSVSVFCLRR